MLKYLEAFICSAILCVSLGSIAMTSAQDYSNKSVFDGRISKLESWRENHQEAQNLLVLDLTSRITRLETITETNSDLLKAITISVVLMAVSSLAKLIPLIKKEKS